MREDDPPREKGDIELSDTALIARFAMRKPYKADYNMSESEKKKVEIALRLTTETIDLSNNYAQDKTESPVRRTEKVRAKPD